MTNEEILHNFFDMMNKMNIPYIHVQYENVIDIPNTSYKIEFNETTRPWKCWLLKDGKEVYSGHPTSTLIMLRYRLATGK